MLVALKSALYYILLFLIRGYKWVELQFLCSSIPILQKGSIKLNQKIGVILHFNEDGDIYSSDTWKKVDEEQALLRCQPKYKSLIHIQVKNKREYLTRCANTWSLGLAETYMDGDWSCPQGDEQLTQFFKRYLENNMLNYYFHPINRLIIYLELLLVNLQTREKSFEVMDKHYNLGNDLYEKMLDPCMQYTCGYWAHSSNLNDAQQDKMELIAKKLCLNKPGLKVLEMGCGWGMLCKHLAERYGAECVGVNISKEQVSYAREACKGLNVDIRMQDYRDVTEKFDRIVVVGMLEHVGFHNYDNFFNIVHRSLKEDGIFLLHTIALNHNNLPRTEPFLHRYIFENGNLPFPSDITKATFGKFIIEDWHNIGPDYAKTLRAWRNNFCENWPLLEPKYGKRFYLMWTYYLSFCAGIFDARRSHLWQIVFSKNGLQTDYRAAR